MNAYGRRQYQQTQVTTVDKGRLIVLLYEGAIKFLHQAKVCQEENDVAGKANHINRALDIISELNQSLNMNEGGDLAQNPAPPVPFLDRTSASGQDEEGL